MWDEPGRGTVNIELTMVKAAVTRAELQVAMDSLNSSDLRIVQEAEDKVQRLAGTVVSPDALLRGLSVAGSSSIQSFVVPVPSPFATTTLS